jgi:DNA-binding response OmpR family regulator
MKEMTPDDISRSQEKLNGVADPSGVYEYEQLKGVRSMPSRLRQILRKVSDRRFRGDAGEEDLSLRDVIESGDFRIDIGSRTVTLRGEKLELTSEEFDVLVFLINHPQRLVTPHTMLATSWATNQPRQTEFLRVLLSLRKKLDAVGAGKHYLRAEPWVTYRFDPTPFSPT